MEARAPFDGTPAEVAREDMKWAAAHTTACGSQRTCVKQGTCLGEPVCEALWPVGRSAGFVAPTSSASRCGYCVSSFKGFICFCPTRWALHRADGVPD